MFLFFLKSDSESHFIYMLNKGSRRSSTYLFISIFLCFTSFVNANTWSGKTVIKLLYPLPSGFIFITEYKNKVLSACNHGGRFVIPLSHPNYQVMVSQLTAAFYAGKQISMNINDLKGNSPSCSASVNRFLVYP